MPEPPGYGVYGPAAGTALAPPPTGTPEGGVLGERGCGDIILVGTAVKGWVAIKVTPFFEGLCPVVTRWGERRASPVMAGLIPAIHGFCFTSAQ
jgi:hypothetical protein